MNWQADQSGIEWTAELGKDGSGYHVLQLQRGRCFVAWWSWPKDAHFTSNRQLHCKDSLYDGASKDGAIAACEQHATTRADKAAAEQRERLKRFEDDYVPTAIEEFEHAE